MLGGTRRGVHVARALAEAGKKVTLIEENKERYYETLEQSSTGWHDGRHDPWPFVNYLLFILKTAYREFEERVGQVASPKGAMERVQRPDGATSGVKVQPLSKGIGEGTVQCPFLGGRNFSPRRSRRPSGGCARPRAGKAFRRLQDLASNKNTKMIEIARSIVTADEAFK